MSNVWYFVIPFFTYSCEISDSNTRPNMGPYLCLPEIVNGRQVFGVGCCSYACVAWLISVIMANIIMCVHRVH